MSVALSRTPVSSFQSFQSFQSSPSSSRPHHRFRNFFYVLIHISILFFSSMSPLSPSRSFSLSFSPSHSVSASFSPSHSFSFILNHIFSLTHSRPHSRPRPPHFPLKRLHVNFHLLHLFPLLPPSNFFVLYFPPLPLLLPPLRPFLGLFLFVHFFFFYSIPLSIPDSRFPSFSFAFIPFRIFISSV